MGTGGINVQPQTGRESSGRIELINGPRGDISLTILLVGLTGKRVQFVSVNQAGCSSKDSGSFASSSKSAAYGNSTQSNASGFVPRHPGCTKRSRVKQHLGEGASYA